MTNYEYLQKKGIINVMKDFCTRIALPFGNPIEEQKEADAIYWLLTEREESNVQLSKDTESRI